IDLDNAAISYTMYQGSFTGGTLELTNGATLVAEGPSSVLRGVTLNGTLDLATYGGTVYVYNGLTVNGTVELGNASGTTTGVLFFVGAQTLGGTARVVFGAAGGGNGNQLYTFANGDSGTLTIGPGITITGQYGYVDYGGGQPQSQTPLV